MRFDYESLKKLLAGRDRLVIDPAGLTPSGVTIPLFDMDGESHILFTLRTQKVKHHKGQISFPGGAMEDGDRSITEAALRETHEEVGIPISHIRVLGFADDAQTISGFHVTPVVVRLDWPFPSDPSPDEIEKVIEIPLSALLAGGVPRVEMWEWGGRSVEMYFYDYGEYTVWGATGRMLRQFLDSTRGCISN
jgi:8-oxo-dGTP pyrophosphatase MutT (NUDIX family)